MEVTKRSSGRMKLAAFKMPPEMIRRLRLLAKRTGDSQGSILRAGLERELAYREAAAR
jgi:predicted DNA-binding protein